MKKILIFGISGMIGHIIYGYLDAFGKIESDYEINCAGLLKEESENRIEDTILNKCIF